MGIDMVTYWLLCVILIGRASPFRTERATNMYKADTEVSYNEKIPQYTIAI
jgi:hypothetical protein